MKPGNLLTDEEFADMMEEFASAGQWMRQQLALMRSTPRADLSPLRLDPPEQQSGACNLQATGDRDYPGQAHGILGGDIKRT
ncbi:hypothetical protein [Pseudomonas syringae]|uniref:hypothetical protein n=1 Tax=Pseudomonas syringae TaxID=317 RepID=UPI00101159B4|nr:hypothetical protein [Pseudomonas syringae]RXT62622.1 hypothetical protein B1F71_23900 [Pseudomonas syringae]RXT98106.1 hypothetical protein B1F75_01525 [Pseudomonas syringae]